MAVLDNAIWLTGVNSSAESGTTTLSEGGNSTTVTGTFTAASWDATQSGQNVSEFGAFAVSEPITALYEFSNPVRDLSFDLQHVNSSGATHDDKFTLRILDASGVLIPADVVIAALTGVTHQSVTTNADGTVSVEGEGSTANDIGVALDGPVSSLQVTYDNGEDAALSGGGGISDLSFTIPPALDYIVEGTTGDDLIDADYLGDPEGDRVDNADALDGSQDDFIDAGDGDDTVLAGEGHDSIDAGYGNDYVEGGVGDDTLRGGWGDDTLMGGDGNDELEGLYGNDLIYAGAGDDHVFGRDQDDLIYGEEGNDTLIGSQGTDTVWGGDGNDTLAGSQGNDEMHGGAGNDLVFIGGNEDSDRIFLDDGKDTLDGGSADSSFYGEGGAGNDRMYAGMGDDTMFGGTGNDRMHGGEGGDSLVGETGDDSIRGEEGDDTLIGGAGADTLLGEDDRDVIHGGAGDVVDGGEGGDDFDVLDLRGQGQTNVTYDADNAEAGTVDFIDTDGKVTGTLSFSNIEKVIEEEVVPCFTPGTMILTDAGDVAVEQIKVGDRIQTLDHGTQVVRWIGTRHLDVVDLQARPAFYPVRILAGALGADLPRCDLLVSPQHRVLLSGGYAEMLFGASEVLAAAAYLVNDRTVQRVQPTGITDTPGITDIPGITYIHLMFDRHEIIRANGAWTESFQPGDLTLAGMGDAPRAELLALFPEAELLGESFAAARPSLKSFEAEILRDLAGLSGPV
jgi:Ca2+-binding RTX toxin-like protein